MREYFIILFFDRHYLIGIFVFLYSLIRLQDWEKEALNSNRTLEYLAAVFYRAFSYTKEMKKLEAGFLLKEIFDRFKNKSLSLLQPNRKLWIYSAHDLTIANILNALNLFEDVILVFFSY